LISLVRKNGRLNPSVFKENGDAWLWKPGILGNLSNEIGRGIVIAPLPQGHVREFGLDAFAKSTPSSFRSWFDTLVASGAAEGG
jgi:hypothetical protein